MQILVDMNLSPRWVNVLKENGHEAVHWISVGDEDAPDRVLMEWAQRHGHVVFTHDLDFSAILAASQAMGPSVVQMRTDDVLPTSPAPVLRVLRQFESELREGAVLSADLEHARIRYLPLTEQ